MKYVVILTDGMADEPLDVLETKTPLEYAKTPNIDRLAPFSEIGMVHTIPKGCAKGSDTANLAVLGYDPRVHYYGRSPLEALSMGVELKVTDITFRANLVTLSEEEPYEDKIMVDHSSDEITTEEARELIECIQQQLGDDIKKFYCGVSYRHLLVWDKGSKDVTLMPPHDFLGQCVNEHKPKGISSNVIWDMMKKSYDILNNHPINEKRRKRGLKPANSIWIWGEGSKPMLPSFKDKYGIEGAIISAVDLLKGIGIGADMASIDVEGATGTLHTNYEGKARAAIKWLLEDDKDFIYIHLEGPDECGHRQEIEGKVKAIEWIDEKIVGPIVDALNKSGEHYKILITPDHPTPLRLRTHTDDPVPYMIFNSWHTDREEANRYTEMHAMNTGNIIEKGHILMQYFLQSNVKDN